MIIDWHVPTILMLFIVMDIISGLLQAIKNKCVDSTVMRNGLFHKIGFIMAYLLSILCEYAMNYLDLGFTLPIAESVTVFICLTELVSILENVGKLSPELASSEFLKYFNKGGDAK